jgi:O-antigen ligase
MFGLSILLSIVFAVALPKFGIMHDLHAGAWRGIYTHKNVLGQEMALSTLVFLLSCIDNKNKFSWIGLFLSMALISLSKSTASILNVVLTLPVFLVSKALRLRYILMFPSLIAITILGLGSYIFVQSSAETIAGLFGKDASLSGRTDVWTFAFDMIERNPWLGYGYGGFWQGLDGESAYIWRASGWNPTHPHNGLLALWLDLGLLGLSIYLLGFAISVVKALVLIKLTKRIEYLWPMTFFIFFVLINLTETNLFSSNSIVWILYVSCASSVLTRPLPEKTMIISQTPQTI